MESIKLNALFPGLTSSGLEDEKRFIIACSSISDALHQLLSDSVVMPTRI